jgi:hypothetical protein
MKNLLKLHEAIALVLLNLPNRTATFQKIADEIERRYLFPKRKGGITLGEQVKLRTSIKSSKYKH